MDPFVHFPSQRVVVCSQCKHAVLPSHINTHLRDEDKHNMPQEDRTRIIEQVQAIEGLITDQAELHQLVLLLASSPPIPELQPPRTNGMQCQLQDEAQRPCRFIICNEDEIRKHCRKKHGWVNKQKGRPKAGTEQDFPWRARVYCQHFFVRGPGAQFFEVQAAESSPVMPSGDVDLDTAKTALKQAMQQAEEEARRQITEPEEAREPNL